jgi:hypothetical protein
MKANTFFSLFVVVLLFAGCSKDDNPATPPSGNTSVSGTIQSFGGQPIAGAVIQAFSGSTTTGTPVATDTSDSAGLWQSVVTSGARYTWVVTAAGLPTSIVTVNVPAGQPTLGLGNTVLAEQTINGIINDAQTGQPVQGAVIHFFSGTGSDTSGYRFPAQTTNAQGAWTGTFTMGSYVGAIYAANHVPLVTPLSVTDTTTGQLTTTITQPVPAGQMRIVLNWGLQPPDLDSHLTGDSTTTAGSPRYHISYLNRVVQQANGDTVAFLDRDDVTSYGPETITIFKFFPGTLRYMIHDYTNRNTTGSHFMSDSSGAIVRVYTSAGLVREDHMLTGVAGNQWHVYNINGTTQQITLVNTIRDGVVSPLDSTFRPIILPEKKPSKE